MIDFISKYWKADKGLFVSILLLVATMIVVVTNVTISYLNLRIVQGQVSLIQLEADKHAHLTIKLLADKNLYYQQYERRFYDGEMNNIHKGDMVKFYTLNSPVEKARPLIPTKNQVGFYYYPIFYLNKEQGVLQVFYFYVYRNLYSIALLFTGLLVLYNGFPIILSKRMLPKVPLFLLLIFLVWLAY
jgi:hypothetical protein